MTNIKFKKRRKFNAITLIIVLCLPISGLSQVQEYEVKAVFLERIARFVEWPKSSEASDIEKPFVITVIGKNPFGSALERLYSKQKINNKKVKIRYILKPEEIEGNSQILFISSSMAANIERIISATQDKNILIVGDTKGFAQKKVHINLYVESKKFPFEINPKAAKESGLNIDYHLLKVAKIVTANGGD